MKAPPTTSRKKQIPSSRVIFFHCHKAGGTTIVDAAKRSGFKLPQDHRNGNPLDSEGKAIKWFRLSDEEATRNISRLNDEGVNFFCFEFSIPKFSVLDKFEDFHYITVLRDPLARAYSNFKMDVFHRYVDPVKISHFSKYMNGDNLVQSNNYYTRFFSGLRNQGSVDKSHLETAIKFIHKFDMVCILERGNMNQKLAPLGFDPEVFGWKNSAKAKKRFQNNDVQNSDVKINSFPICAEFQKNNAFDYALYSYFLHKNLESDYDH